MEAPSESFHSRDPQGLGTFSTERTDVETELKDIAREVRDTVAIVGSLGASGELATRSLVQLQDRASHLNRRLAELGQQLATIEAERMQPQDLGAKLQKFDPLWEQLSSWEQERFIRALVEHVGYDGKTGTVTLGFRSRGIKDICNGAGAP